MTFMFKIKRIIRISIIILTDKKIDKYRQSKNEVSNSIVHYLILISLVMYCICVLKCMGSHFFPDHPYMTVLVYSDKLKIVGKCLLDIINTVLNCFWFMYARQY